MKLSMIYSIHAGQEWNEKQHKEEWVENCSCSQKAFKTHSHLINVHVPGIETFVQIFLYRHTIYILHMCM